MAKKKKKPAKPFRDLIAKVHRGQSLGFGRDKARKAIRGK